MIKKRIIGRKCVVEGLNFVLSLAEIAFLLTNRNAHGKVNIYKSFVL